MKRQLSSSTEGACEQEDICKDTKRARLNILPTPLQSAHAEANAGQSCAEKQWCVTKVVSGGQTGADQAALRAAKQCKLETGGYAAIKFQTTRGRDTSLRDVYGLTEIDIASGSKSVPRSYVLRSMKNVDESDATIAFRVRSTPGTDKTIGYAYSKSWRYLTAVEKANAQTEFLATKNTEEAVSRRSYRPCLVIDDVSPSNKDAVVQQILTFIGIVRPSLLNVCGHRNDGTAESTAYTQNVENILTSVFATFRPA